MPENQPLLTNVVVTQPTEPPGTCADFVSGCFLGVMFGWIGASVGSCVARNKLMELSWYAGASAISTVGLFVAGAGFGWVWAYAVGSCMAVLTVVLTIIVLTRLCGEDQPPPPKYTTVSATRSTR